MGLCENQRERTAHLGGPRCLIRQQGPASAWPPRWAPWKDRAPRPPWGLWYELCSFPARLASGLLLVQSSRSFDLPLHAGGEGRGGERLTLRPLGLRSEGALGRPRLSTLSMVGKLGWSSAFLAGRRRPRETEVRPRCEASRWLYHHLGDAWASHRPPAQTHGGAGWPHTSVMPSLCSYRGRGGSRGGSHLWPSLPRLSFGSAATPAGASASE